MKKDLLALFEVRLRYPDEFQYLNMAVINLQAVINRDELAWK